LLFFSCYIIVSIFLAFIILLLLFGGLLLLHTHHHLLLLLHWHHLAIKCIRRHSSWNSTHLHIAPLAMRWYLSWRHLAVCSSGSVGWRCWIGSLPLRSSGCPPLHLRWHVVHHTHLIVHLSISSIHILITEELVERHVWCLREHSWLSKSTEIHHVW